MMILISMIAVLIFLAAIARVELSLRLWLLLTALSLVGLTSVGIVGMAGGLVLWSAWLLVAAITQIPAIRLNLVSRPALDYIKQMLPPMSETERTAIEAGTVWWDADLFSGYPDFNKLLAYPKPQLSEEEQCFIDGPLETLCAMINEWEINHELNDLPKEVWDFLKHERFLGMIIPKEYGGLEFSALAHSTVVMKVASRSVSAAVSVMVPNSLGPAELLLHYGTQAQKAYYLPRLADGREIPCFALTGPEAGSDAGSIPDYGVVCKGQFEGRDVLGMRTNWDKRYITLGPIATLLGLAFKVYDPDHLLGDKEDLGITCALIPTDTPGVEIGNRHYPLNAAFHNGPNFGHDVFIPMEWVIGGQARIGEGWRMLMESLSAGRSISLPALSTAGVKHAARSTGAYARVRKQFRTPIGKFEGVEEKLARIGGYSYIMDAARELTTVALDQGEKPSVISAILKYNLTEMMRTAIDDAMDVHGGRGICMGPSNYLARTYQAVPVSITVEGANILTRSMIVFGQGAMRCHPYLLAEVNAVHEKNPFKALKDFDTALMGHLGFTTKNMARSFTFGWSASWLAPSPHSAKETIALKRYYQQLHRMSSAFAFTADLALLVLGGALKRKEKLSGRFADALSFLYLGSAVMKRFDDQGRPVSDLPLLHWSMQLSLYQIQESLSAIIRHFPLKPLGWLLRAIVFPLGRRHVMPDDQLGHQVATLIMTPGETRNRLIEGIYYTQNPDDPTGRVEHALMATLKAEPVEKRLRDAGLNRPYDQPFQEWVAELYKNGLMTDNDANILKKSHDAVREAIRVDDFPQTDHVVGARHDEAA
jgi:acyl-CoA dehydrogenase